MRAEDKLAWIMPNAAEIARSDMWGLPVAETVVRPQRYTHDFIENTGRFTLSFYKPEMKKILGVMGSKSGREIDKMNYPGLDAVELQAVRSHSSRRGSRLNARLYMPITSQPTPLRTRVSLTSGMTTTSTLAILARLSMHGLKNRTTRY